ncbi:MAG: undecaprenyl-diphosphate phosphatase [Alphaproteobacteria bacterium]|nr:undecaprenyl-diphosphate phosphatase [Alphaproteobacteria bacterium]
MPLFSIIIFSLVQAVTEFLPISSSGHLVILHGLMDKPGADAWGEDLVMDLAMHMGTLLAVIVYYWRDVWAMFLGLWHWITRAPENKQDTQSRNFAFTLMLASIPVMAVGLILTVWEPSFLRSVQIVVWTTLIYGVLLWWVDAKYPADKKNERAGLERRASDWLCAMSGARTRHQPFRDYNDSCPLARPCPSGSGTIFIPAFDHRPLPPPVPWAR